MSRYCTLFEGTKCNAQHGTPTPVEIAVALGRLARFSGNGEKWSCVLLHSLVVQDLVPARLFKYALLHDAPECVGGDCPSPLKTPDISQREHAIAARIFKAAGLLPLSTEDYFELKVADRLALRGEVHVCGPRALRKEYRRAPKAEKLVRKYMRQFKPMDCIGGPKAPAVKEFLRRYRQ